MPIDDEIKRKETADTGFAHKEDGNAAFKAGNLLEAIRKYHYAVIALKSLASDGSTLAGAKAIKTNAKIADLSDDEEASQEMQQKPDELPKAGGKDAALEETVEDPYSPHAVKKVLTTCFVNMSICHAKRNAWKQCKRSATDALVYDPDNFKARFRVAQATARLGEVLEGRRQLEKLQEEQDDPAIQNELKIIEAAEAAREKKHANAFRGFLKKESSPAPVPHAVGEAKTPQAISANQRFEELDEDAAESKGETPAKDAASGTHLPPSPPLTE